MNSLTHSQFTIFFNNSDRADRARCKCKQIPPHCPKLPAWLGNTESHQYNNFIPHYKPRAKATAQKQDLTPMNLQTQNFDTFTKCQTDTASERKTQEGMRQPVQAQECTVNHCHVIQQLRSQLTSHSAEKGNSMQMCVDISTLNWWAQVAALSTNCVLPIDWQQALFPLTWEHHHPSTGKHTMQWSLFDTLTTIA
jgi:hypothetical protein